MAKIDAATGARDAVERDQHRPQRWAPTPASRSLQVHSGIAVYGTTWHFGAGGNLEGTFKASVGTGDVEWVTDCHGDVYS